MFIWMVFMSLLSLKSMIIFNRDRWCWLETLCYLLWPTVITKGLWTPQFRIRNGITMVKSLGIKQFELSYGRQHHLNLLARIRSIATDVTCFAQQSPLLSQQCPFPLLDKSPNYNKYILTSFIWNVSPALIDSTIAGVPPSSLSSMSLIYTWVSRVT